MDPQNLILLCVLAKCMGIQRYELYFDDARSFSTWPVYYFSVQMTHVLDEMYVFSLWWAFYSDDSVPVSMSKLQNPCTLCMIYLDTQMIKSH